MTADWNRECKIKWKQYLHLHLGSGVLQKQSMRTVIECHQISHYSKKFWFVQQFQVSSFGSENSFESHCILAMLNWVFARLILEVFIPAFSAFVRSQLEYSMIAISSCWCKENRRTTLSSIQACSESMPSIVMFRSFLPRTSLGSRWSHFDLEKY